MAADIRTARLDSGLSVRALARAAGVSDAAVRAIERDETEPTMVVLARLGAALGMELGVRFYPGTGPLVRDHIQAAMLAALLMILHERWRPRPEVAVYRPVRGVVDLVLDATHEPTIACESQSGLRRIEQQLRWSGAKADALRVSRAGGGASDTGAAAVSRLLLLRSTVTTRTVVSEYAGLVAAVYLARAQDAYAALTGSAPWPGDALLWCRVEDGQATVLDRPPRGVRVGR